MKCCKSWRRYKGLRKPKCNNGEGCDMCNETYVRSLMLLDRVLSDVVDKKNEKK